jgi:outer membrane protein assembly factor BamB
MGGLTVITKDLQILWEKPLPNTVGASGIQGIGDCDGDGIPEIAFFHLDGHIACYDGKTGEIQWRIDGLTSGSGHFTSADIDSDGRDEFLYSLGTNEIIALDNDAPNNILWRAKLPATSDTPVIADIDNDGLAEIIVCTSDGYINILK